MHLPHTHTHRCLEDLTSYIAKLESRTSSLFDLCAGSTQDLCETSTDPDPAGVGPGDQEKAHGSGSWRKRKNKMASKTGLEECVPEVKVGGCIRCHQDSDYAQVSGHVDVMYSWACVVCVCSLCMFVYTCYLRCNSLPLFSLSQSCCCVTFATASVTCTANILCSGQSPRARGCVHFAVR